MEWKAEVHPMTCGECQSRYVIGRYCEAKEHSAENCIIGNFIIFCERCERGFPWEALPNLPKKVIDIEYAREENAESKED